MMDVIGDGFHLAPSPGEHVVPGHPIRQGLAGSTALAVGVYLAAPGHQAPDRLHLLLGIVAAALVLTVQRHPCRRLALVPLGWSLLLIAAAFVPPYCGLLVGAGTVLATLPLWMAAAQRHQDARAPDLLVWFLPAWVVGCGALLASLVPIPEPMRSRLLIAVAALGTSAAWIFQGRSVLEAALEVVFWPMYRIRAHGPGARRVPRTGPVLIVCNHSAYADPFWLGKVVPRALRPLMGSVFYDLPVIAWIMRYLIRAIRVPVTGFRRTAPELDEAAASLRRGDCIVVFPEGRLRRKEETLLASFGQGAWRILKQAPQTPVVCVWIEGGWGSFSSYAGGKPMRGKPLDWRRPIDVALAEPVVLPPELLADQEATRNALRRSVLACRRYLGLEVAEDEATELASHGQEDDVHEIDP